MRDSGPTDAGQMSALIVDAVTTLVRDVSESGFGPAATAKKNIHPRNDSPHGHDQSAYQTTRARRVRNTRCNSVLALIRIHNGPTVGESGRSYRPHPGEPGRMPPNHVRHGGREPGTHVTGGVNPAR